MIFHEAVKMDTRVNVGDSDDSKRSGDRKFYDIPDDSRPQTTDSKQNVEKAEFLNYINENVVGKDKVFSGPFGLRKVVYCDYIASGRGVKFIENYIQQQVLPEYANTHTTTTVTSLQTTLFRHEARDIVRNAVNASEHDAVIFVGSGSTGAVHKLISALHLKQLPVVFVGPYEHHSSFLPWKELGAEVIHVQETSTGLVDLGHLEFELKKWQDKGRQLIGCFSAASNITGVLVDVDSVTICLHANGALAFWDYATAAPYVKVDMNPVSESASRGLVYKDAVFISPHKFVGGIDSPGILVAKKKLLKNPIPSEAGGGTVFFVRRDSHRYLQEAEMREEGGTPAIVGAVRAGLAFQLKEAVTADVIMARERQLYQRALAGWSETPQLLLLGNTNIDRLPVFSFLIGHPQTRGLFLHHNFVCSVLNDVFGIQSRGGCQCAGPYAQKLLGIDEDLAGRYETMLLEDSRLNRTHLRRYREYSEREILRPGFSRLNLPYFMTDEEADFVIKAVAMVAENGWKLLPQYIFNPETGEWRHRHHQVFKDRKWLGSISYASGKMQYPEPALIQKAPLPQNYQECLENAEAVFKKAERVKAEMSDQSLLFDGEAGKLRWFLLPSEAYNLLTSKSSTVSRSHQAPFSPAVYDSVSQQNSSSLSFHESLLTSEPTLPTEERLVQGINQSLGSNEASTNEKTNSKSFTREGDNKLVEGDKIGTTEDGLSLRSDFVSGLLDEISSGFTSDEVIVAQKVIANDESSKSLKEGKMENHSCAQRESCHPTASLDSQIEQDLNDITNLVSNDTNEHVHQKNSHNYSQDSCVDTDINTRVNNAQQHRSNQMESHNSQQIQSVNSGKCQESSKCITCDPVKMDSKPAEMTNNAIQSDISHKQVKSKRSENKHQMAAPNVHKWQAPPKKIFNPTAEAVKQYQMLRDGDRVLVCLSGGKDSLSLLHTMHQMQFFMKKHQNVSFELGAVTVDPQTPSFDPSPLKKYLAILGVPYFYEEQCIIQMAQQLPYECASICSYCSRMKRGRLYTAARREGYNVLAMGQHLDDLAESFLMSVFHNGLIRTMKASYTVAEGDLRIIRPFVYVREEQLRNFAEERFLPVIPENCPGCFEAPKERHRMKQLLANQELLFPRLFPSLLSAMKPILAIDKTGISFKDVSQKALEKSKVNKTEEMLSKAIQVKVTQRSQAVP